MIRIFLTIIFFVSVLFAPWWLSVLLAIILLSYFGAYFEVIVGGIVMDSMFGVPIIALFNTEFLYTIMFAILVLTAYFAKRVMM